jgi:hypothetical protein
VTAYAKVTTQQFGPVTRTDPTFAERIFATINGSVAGWAGATFNDLQERWKIQDVLIAFN